MSLQTFKVRLIIKANKLNRKGMAPIFAKITLNSLKIEISTQRTISPKNWSTDKESAYPLNPVNKAFNQYLKSFRNKIYNGYTLLLSTGDVIDRAGLMKAIFGTAPKKRHHLLEVVQEHNDQFEKHVGNKYSAGTFKNYRTTRKYLQEFVPRYTDNKPLPLDKVNYRFCDEYYTFLVTEKTCTNNGAAKQIQRVKTILKPPRQNKKPSDFSEGFFMLTEQFTISFL